MSNVFYSYLEGEERDCVIEQAETDLKLSKLRSMYEMVEMQLENNIKEAELKVFKESGTYDDLEYLIEEANAEATEKKQGIVKQIWEVIKSIFGGIKTSIEKLFSRNDLPQTIDTDQTDVEKHNMLNKVWRHVQNLIKFIQNHKAVSLAVVGSAVAAVLAAVNVFRKKKSGQVVKTPIETVKGWMTNISTKATEIFNNMKPTGDQSGDDNGSGSALQQLGNALNGWKNSIQSRINAVSQSVKNGVTNVKNSVSNGSQDATDATNTKQNKRRRRKQNNATDANAAGQQTQTANESVEDEWVYEGEEGFEDGYDEEVVTVSEGTVIGGISITEDMMLDDDTEIVDESAYEEYEHEIEDLEEAFNSL